MDATPFAYIIYMVYLVAFLGILAGAIFFARGDVQKGKKYLGGAITIVLVSVLLPYVLDYIYNGSGNTQAIPPAGAGNFDAYVNIIYPYPDYVQTQSNTVTLVYTNPMKQTVSIIGVRLNFSTQSSGWVVNIAPNLTVTIPSNSPVQVTVYYPTLIDNDGAKGYTQATFNLDNMVQQKLLNVITINQNNNADVTGSYVIGYSGTSETFIISIKYTAAESGGGSGGNIFARFVSGLANAVEGKIMSFFSRIIGWIQDLGRDVLKLLPLFPGEEAMLFFTLLPTDGMLGQNATVIHDFYYNTALPWGMVILAAVTMLAAVERYWDGQDDLAFSITKDVVGVLIWMFGGYYFYMAFAGFINSIIISIGIQYILRMGYYIDLLMGALIAYSAITVVISDNASGTFVGMILFAVGMFEAIAFMRFFLIAAAVAIYPLIAPWGLLRRTGVGGDAIMRGIVKQGIIGITIASFLKIVFDIISMGNGPIALAAKLLPIAFLLAPKMIEEFISAIHSGDFSHGTAYTLSRGVKDHVQKAGLATSGVVAGKIANYRANKHLREFEDKPAERITVVGDIGNPEPADTGIEYEEVGTFGAGVAAGAAAEETLMGGRGGGGSSGTYKSKYTGRETTAGAAPGPAAATTVAAAAETKEEKGFTVEGLKVKGISHPAAYDYIRHHLERIKHIDDKLLRAELLRRMSRELDEHSKPAHTKVWEGLKMIGSGAAQKDAKKALKGIRKLVGGTASMLGSAMIYGHILATELSSGKIASAAGAHKQAALARKSIELRRAQKEAAIAFQKLAEKYEQAAHQEIRNEAIEQVKKELEAEGIPEVKEGEEGYEAYRELLMKRAAQKAEIIKQQRLAAMSKIRLRPSAPKFMPSATRQLHIKAQVVVPEMKEKLPEMKQKVVETKTKVVGLPKSALQKYQAKRVEKIEAQRAKVEMDLAQRSFNNYLQSINKAVENYVKAVAEGNYDEAEKKKKLIERIQNKRYIFEQSLK